jgi:hypothetical protein
MAGSARRVTTALRAAVTRREQLIANGSCHRRWPGSCSSPDPNTHLAEEDRQSTQKASGSDDATQTCERDRLSRLFLCRFDFALDLDRFLDGDLGSINRDRRGFPVNARGVRQIRTTPWLSLVRAFEQIVNSNAEYVRDSNSEIDSRGMLAVLDRIHGLAADAYKFGEPLLRHFAILESEFPDLV